MRYDSAISIRSTALVTETTRVIQQAVPSSGMARRPQIIVSRPFALAGSIDNGSLLRAWSAILESNYWQISSVVRAGVQELPLRAVPPVMDRITESISDRPWSDWGDEASLRYGRMFQAPISERKFFSTFYTLLQYLPPTPIYMRGETYPFVMSRNIAQGIAFESACSNLLQDLGLSECRRTPTNDQGADLLANHNGITYVFQCKDHEKRTGVRGIQESVAARARYRAARCGVICRSGYTRQARELAQPNYCLLFTESELQDAVNHGKRFVDLISNNPLPDAVRPIEPDYDIVSEYETIRDRLGHTPRNGDLDATTRYRIKKKYGCLSKLIESIGDRPYSNRPSNEDIAREYRRVREAIGRTPTVEDMKRESSFSRNCFSSYPFTRLQQECGDRPNVIRNVTEQELIQAFCDLRQSLGRIPRQKDLDERGKYRTSYYRSRFGSYNCFLSKLEIPHASAKQRSYREKELVLMYLFLRKAFQIREGGTPVSLNHTALEGLKLKERTFVSPSTFSRRFGNWETFVAKLANGAWGELSNSLDEMTERFLAREVAGDDDGS